MPRREIPRPIAITRHTSDYTLAELDISEVDREVYHETTASFIELYLILPTAVWPRLGQPRRPEGLVINAEHWGDFIDAVVEDAVKDVLYGPEANRLALRSIQAAFADAANIDAKPKKKKKNIFRRFLNFMCFC
uniref:Uncharacterized protein LOC111129330 n=1 Tax=Crassostrea virginica TaxID=6565 RepID=A0A8B8DUY3_CRAVI|nr:uncharacterized protein LOC111129330 [Crassostrea virginica]